MGYAAGGNRKYIKLGPQHVAVDLFFLLIILYRYGWLNLTNKFRGFTSIRTKNFTVN